MGDSERTELLVKVAELNTKLDVFIQTNKDHEKRIRLLEDTTLSKKDIETAISNAADGVIAEVQSMAKLTWSDIGKLSAGIIGAMAAAVAIVVGLSGFVGG